MIFANLFSGIGNLLKNINSISGGIALIDEPEISMHPKWQQKVLQYYRGLFDKNGSQDVQMIIATHSEYVIRSALEDRDNVLIIVLSDDNGIIHSKNITTPTILPTITTAETNYLAFGILSVDYHIELYGYLQQKVARSLGKFSCSVKECDTYITQQSEYIVTLHEKLSSHNTTTYSS